MSKKHKFNTIENIPQIINSSDDELSEDLKGIIEHFDYENESIEFTEKEKVKREKNLKRLIKIQQPLIQKKTKISLDQAQTISENNELSGTNDSFSIEKEQKNIGLITKQEKVKASQQFENAEFISEKIIQQMEDAYQQDLQLNKDKKPAIEKFKISQKILAILKQSQVQTSFLESQGLDVLEKWIQKMPDGNKPSQLLRQQILEILNCLNFQSDFVPSSYLGNFLMNIYKDENQQETTQMKKLAKLIIDKWSRSMTKNKINYFQQKKSYEVTIKQKIIPSSKDKQNKEKEDRNHQDYQERYVKVPMQKTFDFKFNPISQIPNEFKSKVISQKSKDIYKLLINKNQSKKK